MHAEYFALLYFTPRCDFSRHIPLSLWNFFFLKSESNFEIAWN